MKVMAFHTLAFHIRTVLKACALCLGFAGLISCACPSSTRGSGESSSPNPLNLDLVHRPGLTCCSVEEVGVAEGLLHTFCVPSCPLCQALLIL